MYVVDLIEQMITIDIVNHVQNLLENQICIKNQSHLVDIDVVVVKD